MVDDTVRAFERELSSFRELVADVKVAMLTTLGPDGVLHARPLVTLAIEREGTLWFFARARSSQAKDIRRDGRVSLGYASDEGARFAAVTGVAEIVRDVGAPSLAPWLGNEDDPDRALVCVRVTKVEYFDSPLDSVAHLVEFSGVS
jgi:general stress protein 26